VDDNKDNISKQLFQIFGVFSVILEHFHVFKFPLVQRLLENVEVDC